MNTGRLFGTKHATKRSRRNFANRQIGFQSLERRDMFSVGMSLTLVASSAATPSDYAAEVATVGGTTHVIEKSDMPNKAANAGEIALGAVIGGKINTAGDQDWLKFKATSNTVIGTVSGSGVKCEVLDKNLRSIGTVGNGAVISVAAGKVYYLRIVGTAPGVGNLSYEVAVQHPGNTQVLNPVAKVTEPSDLSNNFVDAKSIVLGAVIGGKINTASDQDWLKFKATSNTVIGTVSGSGVKCEVLDKNLRSIGTVGNGAVISVTAGEVYYLRIVGTAPGVANLSYSIALWTSATKK